MQALSEEGHCIEIEYFFGPLKLFMFGCVINLGFFKSLLPEKIAQAACKKNAKNAKYFMVV